MSEKRKIAVGEYLKMKKINYILYIKLQQISSLSDDGSYRYIDWYTINKAELIKELRTQSRYFYGRLKKLEEYKELIEIIRDEKGDIKMIKLYDTPKYICIDVDQYLFRRMTEKFSSDICFRVYLLHMYELKKTKSENKDGYFISLKEIAEKIGYSKTHLSKIIECNKFLQDDLKIITYHKEKSTKSKAVENYYKLLI